MHAMLQLEDIVTNALTADQRMHLCQFTLTLICMKLPRARTTFCVCYASSLVGERTNT